MTEVFRKSAAKSCSGLTAPAKPVPFDIETTGPEIVSVRLLGKATPWARCVERTIWAQRLDPAEFTTRHGEYRVDIAPIR